MKEIISAIEHCAHQMKKIKSKYDLNERADMNLLWWKWHEEQRGLIKACRLLGVRVECTDLEGLVWKIAGAVC